MQKKIISFRIIAQIRSNNNIEQIFIFLTLKNVSFYLYCIAKTAALWTKCFGASTKNIFFFFFFNYFMIRPYIVQQRLSISLLHILSVREMFSSFYSRKNSTQMNCSMRRCASNSSVYLCRRLCVSYFMIKSNFLFSNGVFGWRQIYFLETTFNVNQNDK